MTQSRYTGDNLKIPSSKDPCLDSSPELFTDSPRPTDGGDCLTLGTLLLDFFYDSQLETLVKIDLGQRTLGRSLGGSPGGVGCHEE